MLKTRTITGTEKLKVFKHIEMAWLLPKMDTMEVARIQHLWTELLEMNHLLSKSPNNMSTADVSTFEDYMEVCCPLRSKGLKNTM